MEPYYIPPLLGSSNHFLLRVIMAKFRVKRIDAQDPKLWALLVNMDVQCFDDAAPPLTDNQGVWWMAYHEDAPVAYAAIRQSSTSIDGGYLSRAGVMPLYRGNGLQKLLIRRRLAYAKTQGWRWVATDTNNNPISGNSLIACGFKLYTPTNLWSFDTANYWRKYLNSSIKP